MTKYLVTGGAGFIGSHLVEALIDQGKEVVVLDNLSSGTLENLTSVRDKIEFVEGNIKNVDLLNETMNGVEIVFHEAANASVLESIKDPIATHEVNLTGTLNVLTAARDQKVKRVVFASSAAVYDDSGEKTNPKSPYALHKLAGEYYGRFFYESFGLETVSLRYFNVFGTRQDPQSPYSGVITKFIERLKNNQSPTIYGDGQQTRDFVYIKDVVQANLLAAHKEGIAGGIFNVGTGMAISVHEVASILNRILGVDLEPTFEEERKGENRHSKANIELTEENLGYAPQYSFEEGLREITQKI